MKRVLVVTTGLGLGGAETQVVQLARRSRDCREAVAVMSLIPSGVRAPSLREAGVPAASLAKRLLLAMVPPAARRARLKLKGYLKGARLYFAALVATPGKMPAFRLLRTYASYVRFSLKAGAGMGTWSAEAPSRLWCLCAIPLGVAAYLRDKVLYGRSQAR